MADHDRRRHPTRWRKLRYSVAALMGWIFALALLLAVSSPLSRLGAPPCLTPIKTAGWLIAKPASASCMDCHDRR